MTAKAYLSQAYRIEIQIRGKLELIQSLRSVAEQAAMTFSPAGIRGPRNVHRAEELIATMLDKEAEIIHDLEELQRTKNEIIGTVESIDDPDQRALLEFRYVSGKMWEDIASTMYCTVRHVHRIHGMALIEVEKKITAS